MLDIQSSQVVHGIAGQREEYQPIQSQLVDTSEPIHVAKAFQKMGFDSIYLADLDAIDDASSPSFALYRELVDLQLRLWVDCGTSTSTQARSVLNTGVDRVILGLESLTDAAQIASVIDEISCEKTILSLDMKNGSLLTRNTEWQKMSPAQLSDQLVRSGIEQLLILDLASVGTQSGNPSLEIIRQLSQTHPNLTIHSGGGIRTMKDVFELVQAGCDKVLVATALHRGTIG